VNIKKAKQIVILTPNVGEEKPKKNQTENEYGEGEAEDKSNQNDGENLLDAKTIFKYNIIKKKNPQVIVVTELINHENIAFLLDNPLLYHFMTKPGFD